MKHICILVFSLSLFTGCSERQDSANSLTDPSPEAMDAAANPESSTAAGNDSQPIIEYVWHKEGPEFSEEALAEAANKWNSLIDDGVYEIRFANILTPHVDNENFDFIWAIAWESMEARNAGWNYWQGNQETEWREFTSEVFSYSEEGAYSFLPSVQRPPAVQSDSSEFEVQFQFCALGEQISIERYAAFQAEYEVWLDEFQEANGPLGYWYVDLEPQFEMEEPVDFVWLHIWPSLEDKSAGMAAWGESALNEEWQSLAQCQLVDFSGKQIRSS